MENNVWVEKYRPTNFNNIIGQDKNINMIKNMIKNNSLPHLLFHGTSGVGKTTTINAIVNEIYGDNKIFMVMRLDASDDRGINTVRDEIKGFAEKLTLFNKGVKLIILDEVDSMTFDAQFALRRIIEKYSDNTRFCLICNYENKIIQPIKSRCVCIRFYPINNNIIFDRLKYICKNENIKYSTNGLNIIVNISNGDMRKAINILQSLSSLGDKINSDICCTTNGYLKDKIIDKFYNKLLDKDVDFNNMIEFVEKYIFSEGIFFSTLMEQLCNKLIENNIIDYFSELAELEKQISVSTQNNIYIIGIICIFKKN